MKDTRNSKLTKEWEACTNEDFYVYCFSCSYQLYILQLNETKQSNLFYYADAYFAYGHFQRNKLSCCYTIKLKITRTVIHLKLFGHVAVINQNQLLLFPFFPVLRFPYGSAFGLDNTYYWKVSTQRRSLTQQLAREILSSM